MDDFLATNGGISDDVGYSALTMSENQAEMAGISSGDVYIAAGNSSIHEEQQNGLAVSPMPPARNVANTVGSSAMYRTLTMEDGMFSPGERATYEDMSAAGSRRERSMSELEHYIATRLNGGPAAPRGVQAPLEDMPAAGNGNSSTAASESGSDVDNAPLNGASQQVGTMDAGSTIGLPMLSEEPDWSLDEPSVQDWIMRDSMGRRSSNTMTGTIDPRILIGGAESSANITANATPADPLAGAAQPAEDMNAGSSINNNNMVAPAATLDRSGQQPGQMGVDNSANYPVATQATPNGFYVQPQMPMVAGNSTNNFAAQQLSVASPIYNNFQGVQQQLNFASLWPNGYEAASAMAYQQLGGLNGGAQTNMGQNWQAPAPQPAVYEMGLQQQPPSNGLAQPYMGVNVPIVAPQVAAPVAVARTRHRQGDASGPAKRRRTDPAPAGPAPTGVATAQAPAQQQIAAQQEEKEEGPYTHTAAGAPNLDSTKKGNRQGQVPYWGQAFRHHKSRCDKLTLNGCAPECQVRAKWPETWADWNSRRFRVQWKMAQNERPQIEDLSGFAVHSEGKGCMARFVVLGEIQADGSVGKAKPLHRVEVAAVIGPQSG